MSDKKVSPKTKKVTTKDVIRKVLKELVVDEEKKDLKNAVLSFVDVPEHISLSSAEVLCEPYLWLIFFENTSVTPTQLEDDFGVAGSLTNAFHNALKSHYGTNEWKESKFLLLVKEFVALGRSFIRYPAIDTAPYSFLREVKPTLDTARDLIDYLDWNKIRQVSGRAAASKFRNKCLLRSDGFAKRNRAFMRVATPNNSLQRLRFSDHDDEEDEPDNDEIEAPQRQPRPRRGGRKE